jgi:TonB family protein
VEILSKPNPVYTEEGRKLGLQGEVVLAVVFTASGKLRVLRVVQGLGHGLDESAWRAAEQIRFKPAQRDGQPMDFRATVRVVFQLAG